MRRRDFISLIGGAVAMRPLAAHAQHPAIPAVGFLNPNSPETNAPDLVPAFHKGLGEAGFVEGQNVQIEHRWANNQYDRLPALASDLVRLPVAAIAALGGPASALAAKTATTTIPIVFSLGSDPVKLGLVASLNRPGGNITGVSYLTVDLEVKLLEILHEVIPRASVIAILVNPKSPDTATQVNNVQAAARTIGKQIIVLNVQTESDIDAAFAEVVQQHAAGLLVEADPFLTTRRARIISLAAQHAIPAAYAWREFATAGGLMSYGTSLADAYRHVGFYVGRILKGEKPADLPVMQATKFELVINLKTAKTLGLMVPNTLLVTADEVIE